MNTKNNDCGCVEYTPTLLERIGHKLFPQPFPNYPEDAPIDHITRDCVVTRVDTDISIIDRLRILVSGRVQMEARVNTENIVGSTTTAATFSVKPPRFLERK